MRSRRMSPCALSAAVVKMGVECATAAAARRIQRIVPEAKTGRALQPGWEARGMALSEVGLGGLQAPKTASNCR